MANCYKCLDLLTEQNRSEEHIILNACGGRLKSKDLLCNKCNNEFGVTADAALADSVKVLASYLNIRKERGEHQNIRTTSVVSGESYYLEEGYKPVRVKPIIKETRNGNEVELKIVAGNEKQYREIAKGYVKKYPKLKMEDFDRVKKDTGGYLGETLHVDMDFGGPDVFRAIVKTAINFYLFRGGNRENIVHLLPYITGEKMMDVVWLHYPEAALYQPKQGEVSNVLQIVGNPSEKILYAYVELFNCHSFIVKMHDDYSGPNINVKYGYNLLAQHEIQVQIDQVYSRIELLGFLTNKEFVNRGPEPFVRAQERFSRVVKIGEQIHLNRHVRELTKKILTKAFELFPMEDGDSVAREKFISSETDKEITRFMESRLKSQNPSK